MAHLPTALLLLLSNVLIVTVYSEHAVGSSPRQAVGSSIPSVGMLFFCHVRVHVAINVVKKGKRERKRNKKN